MSEPNPISYSDAGVDVDAANRAVELIRHVAESSRRPEMIGGIGGFAGLFAFDARRYVDPVLVSSTDGVGTKVELARRLDVLETVGQDLVAMVVDDLVVSGAEPLFLNDYLTVGRLDPERVARIVAGVVEGCRLAGCALLGGETAEHPGLIPDDAFDLAGFAVGVVERDRLLSAERVRAGDVLVALGSSGLHANGYSLVRRLIEGLDLREPHGLDRPLGQVLLTPTRIYVRDCLALAAAVDVRVFCHITGGGLPGNLPRVLPEGLGVLVEATTWEPPAIYQLLRELGPVAEAEMWRTFNLGIGMVAVVAPDDSDDAVRMLTSRGVQAWAMGSVREVSGVEIVAAG
ncbi:MAG: phosphoribosylformylglycinamidine cyclo-ligase [Actinomycetota bacterium]|nr:phosphoribosylformylglycinamidine cyclo-ligase [Actinomycetota bacterium]